MLNVKNLLLQKYKADDIAKMTNSSAGRVYITTKNLRTISFGFLDRKLKQLAKLDSDIKHGKVNRFLAFETFLLEY